MKPRIAVVVLVLVAGACTAGDATPSPFSVPPTLAAPSTVTAPAAGEEASATRWGFVPFPAGPDLQSVGDAFRFVAAEGDLVAFHFDDGIPWQALLAGSDLPPALVEEMAALRAFSVQNPQLGVYVATAITDKSRSDIPGSWRAGGPPPEIAGRSFDDADVREGIRRWVRYVAEELEPDWFNLAVEINMYETARPADYPNLLSLYRELYHEVKAAYPDMVVFASFQMELGNPQDAEDLVDALDLVGVSTYPYLTGDGIPPEDYLSPVAEFGLPLAVAETGYPAAALPTMTGEGTFTPSDQAAYVEWLGRRAASPGLVFVTWFFPTDITGWIDPLPAADQDLARLFEFLGMRTADGTARPALDVWRGLASP